MPKSIQPMIVTSHFIAGRHRGDNNGTFSFETETTEQSLPQTFPEATGEVIDDACRAAEESTVAFQSLTLNERADLLDAIADELDADVEQFAAVTPLETRLPEARIRGELGRTSGQLRLFAEVVRIGDILGARIDRGNPNRRPMPKPDIRQRKIPLGAVAVFGASNFPLAFSVAGGDAASALAAGCPIVVKAHPGHPLTSALTANAISRAVKASPAPDGTFSMVHGSKNAVGATLVQHPAIKAVGFTGSFQGGSALAKLAAARSEPIPLYAEMGSVNPMFLLPEALADRARTLGKQFVGSLTLGAGQFCTKSGIVIAQAGDYLETFCETIASTLEETPPGSMLHSGIQSAYVEGLDRLTNTHGVSTVAIGSQADGKSQAQVFRTTTAELFEQPSLLDEVFGPASLIVEALDREDMLAAAELMPGQLTATIHYSDQEIAEYAELVTLLERRAGRVLFNGYPTGVEVCHAMVHGGPYPATSDSRMTSVGTLAIDRFLRPVCYQDCPQELLPQALIDANPLGIRRLVDGEWSTERLE